MANDFADIPFLRVGPIHASKLVGFVKIGADQEFQDPLRSLK